MKTWVVVACAARARVFEVTARNQPWNELFDLLNPQDRLPVQELRSDKPGRAFNRFGGASPCGRDTSGPKGAGGHRLRKAGCREVGDRALRETL